MNQDFLALLKQNNLRATHARMQLFTTLSSAHSPLSAVELSRLCTTIDKASVYRTIETFLAIGLILSVTRHWKNLYELASPFVPHHHHMVCIRCGRDEEIQSDAIESVIKTLGNQHGFISTGHHFEVTGICRDCATPL